MPFKYLLMLVAGGFAYFACSGLAVAAWLLWQLAQLVLQ